MDNDKFIMVAKSLVEKYINEKICLEGEDYFKVYVVWLCKTLQNNKALLSTDIKDGRYYEITYNGDKKEFYLDVYKKEENKAITFNE